MAHWTGKLLLWLGALASGSLSAAKIALDVIGIGGVEEDLKWWGRVVRGIPGDWIVYAGLLAVFCIGIFLATRSRRTKDNTTIQADHEPSVDAVSGQYAYESDHEALMHFVVDHLLPTSHSMSRLQHALVDHIYTEANAASLVHKAVDLNREIESLHTALTRLHGLENSPPDFVDKDEMIECVNIIERQYAKWVWQYEDLLHATAASVTQSGQIRDRLNEWRSRRDEMVRAYEPIKRNSRLGKLFRPTRPSRWSDGRGFKGKRMSRQSIGDENG